MCKKSEIIKDFYQIFEDALTYIFRKTSLIDDHDENDINLVFKEIEILQNQIEESVHLLYKTLRARRRTLYSLSNLHSSVKNLLFKEKVRNLKDYIDKFIKPPLTNFLMNAKEEYKILKATDQDFNKLIEYLKLNMKIKTRLDFLFKIINLREEEDKNDFELFLEKLSDSNIEKARKYLTNIKKRVLAEAKIKDLDDN
ncbi:MAG: hypothetical protein ACTSYR_05730 [Candidatus Odinarchaeia archaeon]